MEWIDTHCHIDGEEFDADRDAVLERARETGVSKIFVPAIDLKTSLRIIELCQQHPDCCYPMVGLHPEEVRSDWCDQLTAIRWVKAHISAFGGDGENVTLMGQSAGAISIQYLCLNPAHRGLFRRAVMLSGAGLFPRFSLPRPAAGTRAYWLRFMELAGCRSFEALKAAPLETVFDTVEKIHALRKDNVYHTMPVVDGALLPGPVDELIRTPLAVDYLIGFTNNDMYAPLLAYVGSSFGRRNGAYLYCFDLDAPGDDNRAFHSADVRFVFGTLDRSWRPYGPRDYEASAQMMDYLAAFVRTGDPNGPGLPAWEKGKAALRIGPEGTRMAPVPYGKLLWNMLKRGDPKA